MDDHGRSNGPTGPTDWNAIDWCKANRLVRNLRQRIFRATRENDLKKVRSLQKLLLRSWSNLVLSVRRATQQNQGKNPAEGFLGPPGAFPVFLSGQEWRHPARLPRIVPGRTP